MAGRGRRGRGANTAMNNNGLVPVEAPAVTGQAHEINVHRASTTMLTTDEQRSILSKFEAMVGCFDPEEYEDANAAHFKFAFATGFAKRSMDLFRLIRKIANSRLPLLESFAADGGFAKSIVTGPFDDIIMNQLNDAIQSMATGSQPSSLPPKKRKGLGTPMKPNNSEQIQHVPVTPTSASSAHSQQTSPNGQPSDSQQSVILVDVAARLEDTAVNTDAVARVLAGLPGFECHVSESDTRFLDLVCVSVDCPTNVGQTLLDGNGNGEARVPRCHVLTQLPKDWEGLGLESLCSRHRSEEQQVTARTNHPPIQQSASVTAPAAPTPGSC